MPRLNLTPRAALVLFISLTVVLIAQFTWWIIFMARLVDEKVKLAQKLGADESFVELLHQQEIRRQVMVGMEGLFFLALVALGAYLIYRTLIRTEDLKFHQQNFLMAVTHELKTPLASMKIYLDSLESSKIAPEKKEKIIPNLKEDANRLGRLVENVLDAGRFERSGYRLNPQSFDLSDKLRQRLDKLEKYPAGKPITVRRGRFDAEVECYGDPAALGRAIDAILENSVKYNDKDRIEVEVDLFEEDTLIYLNFSDNGIGLIKADRSRIFNRFYRVGAEINRQASGSGLGLYLCREIIKAHGGQVTAHSDGIGKGVRFNIKLKTDSSHANNSIG